MDLRNTYCPYCGAPVASHCEHVFDIVRSGVSVAQQLWGDYSVEVRVDCSDVAYCKINITIGLLREGDEETLVSLWSVYANGIYLSIPQMVDSTMEAAFQEAAQRLLRTLNEIGQHFNHHRAHPRAVANHPHSFPRQLHGEIY